MIVEVNHRELVAGAFIGDITGDVTGDLTGNVTGQVSTIANHLLDEDNMATDSATKVPSQQSVKAYVDGQARKAVLPSREQ